MMTEQQTTSPVQQALGEVWQQLPAGLQAHYRMNGDVHREQGHLDVAYPRWLQWPMNLIVRMGALLNRQGKAIPTTVERRLEDGQEYWFRSLVFADGETMTFTSQTVCVAPMQIIEFSNQYLGLRMTLSFAEDCLHYHSDGYVLRLAGKLIRIPEWLALGYGSIEERAVGEHRFVMDFGLRHPLFGQVFRYSGEFEVE
ncbi:DUF4166 domain-containing protein [Leucothrix pacifica]|uniref:DUF4166 domain-containing protein n=1 Tax=Leucothrix pacifica TaxID=1247513 RepID=A0A317C0J8_9GAMM|nr:DUF4166 domain-containing protein [Leucothrix pacifica]PWQ92176.1 DUF4166 domain-containing protein [Leucothrix pacifica]